MIILDQLTRMDSNNHICTQNRNGIVRKNSRYWYVSPSNTVIKAFNFVSFSYNNLSMQFQQVRGIRMRLVGIEYHCRFDLVKVGYFIPEKCKYNNDNSDVHLVNTLHLSTEYFCSFPLCQCI